MSRNDIYGGLGLALLIIDALIIWAALSGYAEFALHALEGLVVWTVFAGLAGLIIRAVLRTSRELEGDYEKKKKETL